MNPTNKQILEMKKTWKGRWKLYKLGVAKFKQDPPIYRIHMMQGLMTKMTMYMIIFACIYAVSIGLWVFALILLPVGTVGNYYGMKAHFIKYKEAVINYEMAGILKPIDKDISNMRKKWRIIEKQIGFFGIDLSLVGLIIIMAVAYFGDYTYWGKIGLVFGGLVALGINYFTVIYGLCNWRYRK